jgi:AraC-like DNA-binding protein
VSTTFARIELPWGATEALHATDFAVRFPPHFHRTFAIGVVESGSVRLRTRDGEGVCEPGSFFALSPGEIHSADCTSPHGYSFRVLYPDRDFMRNAAIPIPDAAPGDSAFCQPVIHEPSIAREFLAAHSAAMNPWTSLTMQNRLRSSLASLAEGYAAKTSDRLIRRPAIEIRIAETVKDFLGAHIGDRVGAQEIADACALSPFYVIRVFRRVVGLSPHAYLVQLRLNRAEGLLAQRFSVAEAAYACGFADQSHLARTFKCMRGVSPGQFIRARSDLTRV